MTRTVILSVACAVLCTPAWAQFNNTWIGGDANFPNVWDVGTTANWSNSTQTPDVFFNGDVAIFDETASTFDVEIVADPVTGILPGSMVFSNSNPGVPITYTFTGAAGINDFDAMNPTGMTIGNGVTVRLRQPNSTYSGLTTIDAGGTLQIGVGDIGANSFGLGPVVNNGMFILNEPGGSEGVINPGAVGSDPQGDNLKGSGDVLVLGGTLQLQSPNTYTGTTTVEVDGGLELRSFADSLGATSAGTTVNGGVVWFRGIAGNIDEPIAFNGGRIRVGQYDIGTGNVVSSAVLTSASTIDVGSIADFQVTVDSDTSAGNTFTIESNITGSAGFNFNAIVGAGSTLFVPGNFSHNGNIVKTGAGTLSLTGTNTHSGATLVNAGSLTAGGTYTVAASQVLGGNGGTVIDNTLAQSGGTIAVGNGPLVGVNETVVTYNASITYVDADTTNTVAVDSATYPGTTWFDPSGTNSSATSDDNLWLLRAFANGATVFGSNDLANATNGGEDAPALRTTISGLTPGQEFQVFAFGWSSQTAAWRLRASLDDPNSDGTPDGQVDEGWNARQVGASAFTPMFYVSRDMGGENPGPFSTDNFDSANAATTGFENGGVFTNGTGVVRSREGDRGMSMAVLGTAVVDANGNIQVYIDDLANTTSANNRTWYDGVGFGSFEEIITPLPTFVTDLQVLTIDNDLTLDAGSSLEIELLADNVYDKLVVTGQLTANGSLDVVYGTGTPDLEVGDTFDILDWGTLVGSFAAINLPTLGAGLAWDQSMLLTDGILGIISAPSGLAGDFNGDGVVDAADYTVWRDNLGATDESAFAMGSGTGDNMIDAADYALWRSNFGSTAAALTQAANVPEPTALLLAVIGGLVAAGVRRRG